VDHTEPEFFLQAFNEIKVGFRESNGCGFEVLVLHESLNVSTGTIALSLPKSIETAERQLSDISEVSLSEEFQ
jgi:hypothetical protein